MEPLSQIEDARGKVLHMLRADAPHFLGFGEIYFSVVKEGVVKAWKQHQKVTQNLTVPLGEIEIVLYDDRKGSATRGVLQKYLLGEANYFLLQIPPLIWYGFRGVSQRFALIANCTDLPHDPSEVKRLPENASEIPFSWGKSGR